MPGEPFVEVAHYGVTKYGESLPGDVFMSRKDPDSGRVVSVLADGLGSGVKANVPATMTATMALRFVAANMGIRDAARTIMDALPVCRRRGLAYSTFTIVDVEGGRHVRMFEHDNPPVLLIRDGARLRPPVDVLTTEPENGRAGERGILRCSRQEVRPGDRIVVFSDGVSQSGLGTSRYPAGWGWEAAAECAIELVRESPSISARDLSRHLVRMARARDGDRPKDDITCGVVYFRCPRDLLLVTGPPFAQRDDRLIADALAEFRGSTIVCGGTTAAIVARELGREVHPGREFPGTDDPPMAAMEGIGLVTEGTVTLTGVADLLDEDDPVSDEGARSPAGLVLEHLLNSDRIRFLVGTRINPAHQDPRVPVELDLRRNLVRRIARSLRERHLKEVDVHLV